MRAFLYCRVARDDSFALEHQRFLLQLYAKQAGYTIIGAADEYGSGLTLDRPALQKVTEAVVAGKVDVVLVHNLTRIGREWGMTQSYIDLLTRHKVKLLCIRDRLLFDENLLPRADDSFALEHQRQRFLLQLYAKQAGYTIIGAADEYGSGLTLERPALQKVTEAVVAGKVDVVLVHSLTRIGREWGMTQRYIDLLTRHKVKLLCIRDRLLFDETGAAPILTIKMRSGLCRILRSYKDTPHGPSGETRTPGILLPKQARYQLRYTRIGTKATSCEGEERKTL